MNRLKELKSFLKDFEAEEYEGIEVEYKQGSTPRFFIYHDGKLQENVYLGEIPSKVELHELMVTKGFVKKTEEEIEKMKKIKYAEQRIEDNNRNKEKTRRRKHREELKALKERRDADALEALKGEESDISTASNATPISSTTASSATPIPSTTNTNRPLTEAEKERFGRIRKIADEASRVAAEYAAKGRAAVGRLSDSEDSEAIFGMEPLHGDKTSIYGPNYPTMVYQEL